MSDLQGDGVSNQSVIEHVSFVYSATIIVTSAVQTGYVGSDQSTCSCARPALPA